MSRVCGERGVSSGTHAGLNTIGQRLGNKVAAWHAVRRATTGPTVRMWLRRTAR